MNPRSFARLAGALLFTLVTTACSGGSSTGDASASTGNVSITLSDAASTTLSMFEVDVRSITFTARNGRVVSVAPRATRIDFVQLDGLNDLVATASLPAGNYSGASLTLDFANANVLIAGQSTPATVRDTNGLPLTGPVDVQVDFGGDDRLVVVRGRNHLFAFDLDIDQSVAIDGAGNVVTFTPVLNLTVDPSNDRPIGTPGVLRTVDTNAGTFTVERRADDGTVLHTFTVATTATTVFQVDGVPSLGAAGVGALLGEIDQRVLVLGELDRATSRIAARAVEAGDGVPGNGLDWIVGHVVARDVGAGSDAVLTVRGASFDVATGTRRYDSTHTVSTTRAFTKVLRRGSATAFGSDDVNVGQQVQVFGALTGTAMDAINTGIVRMLATSFRGAATGAPTGGALTLGLTQIDRRDLGQFTFTIGAVAEADPTAFTFDVTGLATNGIDNGTRVEAVGFVNTVGGTGRDARALELVTRQSDRQLLLCEWSPASQTALSGATTGVLTLDLTGSPFHIVRDHAVFTSLTPSPAPVVRGTGNDGHYRIVKGHQVAAYRDFAEFRSAVLTRLVQSSVVGIGARGAFDATTQTMTATDATVVFR